MSIYWFVLFIILLLIEIMTINLVSIWFAIGALASCIISIFTSDINIQIIVFIVVSLITLLITKPLMKKIRTRPKVATNLDRVIGRVGVVTEEITDLDKGEVRVDGKRWTAVSKKKLALGTKVKVLKLDGVKAVVEEFKEEK